MIAGDNIPDIPDHVEEGSLRVHAASLVVFICGGKFADTRNPVPASLRDAFMRAIHDSPLAKYEVILAEDPGIFAPIGEYTDLIKFEADVAQLTELLLLFSESAGSWVELGMFVLDHEVASKMMLALDDENHNQESFIKLGPVYSLVHRFGDAAVCVLTLADLDVRDIQKLDTINTKKLLELLDKPLRVRLSQKREPTTFDKDRHGHVTKLIVGLIQYYAALTFDEIDTLLRAFNVAVDRHELKRHIQCAERVGWIQTEKIGIDTYCAARPAAQRNAIEFDLKKGAPIKDRMRWRSDVRDYWKNRDQKRFAVIQKAVLGRKP